MTNLDFSQAKIQAIGTAFTAMNVEVNTRTKQQLREEESIGQQSDTSSTSTLKTANVSDVSSIKDLRVSKDGDETTVLFADPTNGNLVKLNLSNTNIEKLKQHFTDENNFHERKDGSIRLNGEAEAFVSGWFGDIAYKREFLKADANKDGKLCEEEFNKTKGSFFTQGNIIGAGNKVISITETIAETYASRSDSLSARHYSDSIQTALNKTIKSDSNMNKQETYIEFFSGQNTNYATDIIGYAKNNLKDFDPSKPKLGDGLDGIRTILEKTENKEAQKALQKLKASNGDESVLSAEEKEALGTEIKAVQKQLEKQSEKESDLRSIKDEIKGKVESTQFLDVKG